MARGGVSLLPCVVVLEPSLVHSELKKRRAAEKAFGTFAHLRLELLDLLRGLLAGIWVFSQYLRVLRGYSRLAGGGGSRVRRLGSYRDRRGQEKVEDACWSLMMQYIIKSNSY